MVHKTLDEHIVITPNVVGGKPHIAGHRIKVQHIAIWHNEMKMPVEQIADDYNLSLADVYAALAYYHDHKEEIDKDIKEGEEFAEEMRKKFPSKVSKDLLRKTNEIFEHELSLAEQTLLKKRRRSHRKLVKGQ